MIRVARRLRGLVQAGDPWLLRVGLALILVMTMLVLLATVVTGVDPTAPAAVGIALASLAGIALLALARTEKAAQTAQRHAEVLAHAVDALPGGAVVIDAEGRLVHANAVFQIMVGHFEEFPINALAARLTSDDNARMRFERLAAAAALSQVAQEEVSVTSPTGKTAWWEISAHPVPSLSGYNLWTVSDVTSRREIESVVREEQAKLVDFLENAPIGFYSVDAEGRFEFVNQTLAAWLECTPEDMVITSARLHQFLAQQPPSGTAPYDPFGGQDASKGAEVTLRGRRGRVFQASITQTIVGGGASGALRTRSVVRDLTPERQMAEALRRSEHRFQTLFENAPVVIASLDRQGRVLDCNPALRQLIGAGGQEPIGRTLAELIDPRDRKEAETRIRLTLAGRAPATPLEVRLADGRDRIAALYLSRQTDAAGEAGLMASFVDTTERKSLELQFAQSQKMQAIGQLAGGIAHDFNNLLTAMIGFCDLLLLRHRPGDQSFADIMQIKQNANRAANLVRQLLAFSRQQTLQPKVLNVTDALAELSNLLRRLIGEGIELKMVHGRDLGLVRVDQGQLEQVIINLAVNARDAMSNGGVLTIQTEPVRVEAPIQHGVETMPAGDYVVIEVIDTGTGIPMEILDRIFEPFFSTKEVGQGTGLGLSTVYGIVKQTGGFIFVDSTPGKGTTFRIFLPVHVGQAEEKVAADAEKAASGDLTGSGLVLLVEDEDPVRMFSARALRNKGYTVTEAKSGDAALELIEKMLAEKPAGPDGKGVIDLLITDVVMPNMDGPTLVQHARQRLPKLKVICISGYAEETLAKRINTAGDVYFLPKPFSLKQLAAKVKDVMR